MSSEPKQVKAPKAGSLIAIPKPVLISLLFYLITLAATQSVYGYPFMSLRWVALGTFTLVSFVYWLFGRILWKRHVNSWSDPSIVFIYLGATLLSVSTAENYKFSGLRWATQGMLILSCMVFLRGAFNPEKIKDLLLPLKIIILGLLGISFLFPAPSTPYDNPYFRGAMGDSNSLGHVSAICALVYLYGAMTARKKSWRTIQFALTAFAILILIRSSARSSMLAFFIGFTLVNFYFGLSRSLLVKSAAFIFAALIFASPMLQSKAIQYLMKEEKKIENPTSIVVMKAYSKMGLLPQGVFATRQRLWSESWEGFMQRPFFGWGFGANANVPKEWAIGPTGTTLSRDITNDPLFILEGCGLVGFLGYLFLVLAILKQSPTPQEFLLLRERFRRASRFRPVILTSENALLKSQTTLARGFNDTKSNENQMIPNDLILSRVYVHAQMYILSVSLFVLFLVDGSAFSAGSLISALFWISAGMAGLMRIEARASEKGRGQRSENDLRGLKWGRNWIGGRIFRPWRD
jgi:hypothetical protein